MPHELHEGDKNNKERDSSMLPDNTNPGSSGIVGGRPGTPRPQGLPYPLEENENLGLNITMPFHGQGKLWRLFMKATGMGEWFPQLQVIKEEDAVAGKHMDVQISFEARKKEDGRSHRLVTR